LVEKETSRLSRLTAILIQLQSKRLVTATEIAAKFSISIRTVYRDIRALEEAGVPVCTEEGKGYSIMDGYRLPPVTFTESEANALITAGQLAAKNKDASFVKDHSDAMLKIKSVLRNHTKDKAELLANRIVFRQNTNSQKTSSYLSTLQRALTNFNLSRIEYYSTETNHKTSRIIEPFAMYSTQENWLLIAWCRLRKDFRTFRLDRILQLQILEARFEPHKMTLAEYFKTCREKYLSSP
jgi:predicted DNA-binding transcriptional regulator YafY